MLNFHDFPGLENQILNFHDFPDFLWPVRTLFKSGFGSLPGKKLGKGCLIFTHKGLFSSEKGGYLIQHRKNKQTNKQTKNSHFVFCLSWKKFCKSLFTVSCKIYHKILSFLPCQLHILRTGLIILGKFCLISSFLIGSPPQVIRK